MAEKSKSLRFYDAQKLEKINPETLRLWNKYKIDMTLRELSAGTIDGYLNDLQQWWLFIYDNQGNRPVTELGEDEITEFLYYCKSEGNNSRRMKRRMSSIAAFYKFLRKKKLIESNPMEFIDRPKKDTDVVTQTYLSLEQVAQMRRTLSDQVGNAATPGKKHRALQMRTYALFSLSTMARVNAVSSVRWEQIDFEEKIVTEVLEKEGYLVDLFFNDETKDALTDLKRYREENGIDDGGYVFAGEKGKCITKGTLNKWCNDIGAMIDVPTLHPHDFRHSGATILKNLGMELEDISRLLNHKSTDVTSKFYIKFDPSKLRETKDKFCY